MSFLSGVLLIFFIWVGSVFVMVIGSAWVRNKREARLLAESQDANQKNNQVKGESDVEAINLGGKHPRLAKASLTLDDAASHRVLSQLHDPDFVDSEPTYWIANRLDIQFVPHRQVSITDGMVTITVVFADNLEMVGGLFEEGTKKEAFSKEMKRILSEVQDAAVA